MDGNLLCSKCGASPVSLIVGLEAFCDRHRMEWLTEEAKIAEEGCIQRVMAALDEVLGEEIDGDWNNHLRKLAVRAIEAA
jgi:hypothetical protein